MMTTLDVAESQVGVAEETGNNDGIPATRYCFGIKDPWCAHFVLWCNGVSDDQRLFQNTKERWEYALVQAFEDGMKSRGLWIPYGPDALSIIRPGDVIFFAARGQSDKGPSGRHVGIVRKVGETAIETIEGNWKNAVSVVTRVLKEAVGSNAITGFARPGGFSRQ